MLFSSPQGSKFIFFPIYGEDKILPKYSQVGWEEMTCWLENCQLFWLRYIRIFILHIKLVSKKSKKKPMIQLKFCISSKFSACLLFCVFVVFSTLKVIASLNQFFLIFEIFDLQKVIGRLDINPHFKKAKWSLSAQF